MFSRGGDIMKMIFAAVFLLGALKAMALDDCALMKNKEMEMDVISSNIENVNTTHTPEGGPYKCKRVVCNDSMCAIISYKDTIIKHLPGHPDADKNGDVKFPLINMADEMKALIDARSVFEQAARNCRAKKVTSNAG